MERYKRQTSGIYVPGVAADTFGMIFGGQDMERGTFDLELQVRDKDDTLIVNEFFYGFPFDIRGRWMKEGSEECVVIRGVGEPVKGPVEEKPVEEKAA